MSYGLCDLIVKGRSQVPGIEFLDPARFSVG